MNFKTFYLKERLGEETFLESIDIKTKYEEAKEIAKRMNRIQDFLEYDWDYFVYGVHNYSEIDVPMKDIKLVWKVDAEDAKKEDLRKYFKNESPKNLPAVDVFLQKGGKFSLEDGYHRYFYNKLFKNKFIKANVEIKANPFLEIGIDNPEKFYKEFH